MGMSHPDAICVPSLLNPYKFGVPNMHAPTSFTPLYASQDPALQAARAQALHGAAAWWSIPRKPFALSAIASSSSSPSSSSYPFVGLPTLFSNMTPGTASAYAYPPAQLLPYQQYAVPVPVPPLGAIHNTRCATTTSASPSMSCDTPKPSVVHVICNAPLLAPKPLPYHSPTFLHFDLPDDDEDLSHPPYVSRPHKRKRASDDDEEGADGDAAEAEAEDVEEQRRVTTKRRTTEHHRSPRPRLQANTSAGAGAPYPKQRPPAGSHGSTGSYRHR
ncbi:hypothetical protein BDW22DRAFT_1346116 [Trametopsis cervina]|nr:hypothetical protein BDW22DRAFT_1346116 [Trametopsis cervina]